MGKKKWCCIIIGSILCAGLFVIGIPILINELYKVNGGYITLWGAADVLSFYAVILSGLITIAVLAVTIHYNRKDTEKQINLARSQVNVPFFIIDKVYLDKSQGDFVKSQDGLAWASECELSKHKPKEDQDKIVIALRNIGEGIAIAPKYHIDIDFPTKLTDTIPKFVQKDNVLALTYDLYGILIGKLGESNLTQDFQPFDTILTLTYQNTLGIIFRQEITLRHTRTVNRTAVEVQIDTVSHQCIDS